MAELLQFLQRELKHTMGFSEDDVQVDIIIKMLDLSTVNVSLLASDTVRVVKARIWDQNKIPASQQRLVHEGKELHDMSTLAESRVNAGDTVHLVLRAKSCGNFTLPVQTLHLTKYSIFVDETDFVGAVKSLIKDKEKIPRKQQRLVCHGRELQDAQRLSEENVTGNDVLYLILKRDDGK